VIGIDAQDGESIELRRLAEQKASTIFPQDEAPPAPLTPQETSCFTHELRVHQIELEMQNEELRRSHAELDAIKERYFDLFDMAPVGYLTLDEAGVILEANLRAATLLDVHRNELVNKPMAQFILREDQDIFFVERNRLMETRKPVVCELRMVQPDDDRVLWVLFKATIMEKAPGSDQCRVVLSDITELKITQDTLRKQLDEQKILLRETHHRIKNNIAAIENLLSLQSGYTTNQEAIQVIQEAIGRLEIMRELYDRMSVSGEKCEVQVNHYLEGLSNSIFTLFASEKKISFKKHFDDFTLGSRQLFPFGIIANELLTNALKYAFVNRPGGTLGISATICDDIVTLVVRDDGAGFPEGFDPESSNGFGLLLVQMLSRQLEGSFRIENDEETSCILEFRRNP